MATRRKPTAERRDRQAFEERRLNAAELFAQDIHQAEVARTLGVSRQTVLQKVKRGELQAVLTRTGRRKGLRINVPSPTDTLF